MDNDSFVSVNSDEFVSVRRSTPSNSNSLMDISMPPSTGSNGQIVLAQEVVPSPAPAPPSDNNSVIKWLVSLEEERQHAESEKKIRNEKENSVRLIQYYWRNYIQVKQRRFRERIELSITNIGRAVIEFDPIIKQFNKDVGNLSRRIDFNQRMILNNSRRIEECSGRIEKCSGRIEECSGRIEELQIAINEINEKINKISGSLEWNRETQNMFDPRRIYRAVRTDGGLPENGGEAGTAYYPFAVQNHCLLFEFSGSTKGRIDYTDKTRMRHVVDGNLAKNANNHYDVVVEYLPIAC